MSTYNYYPPRQLHHHPTPRGGGGAAAAANHHTSSSSTNNNSSNRSLKCQDYASRPQVTKPSPYHNKRDAFLVQKLSSRNTMTTATDTTNSRLSSYNDLTTMMMNNDQPQHKHQQQQHQHQNYGNGGYHNYNNNSSSNNSNSNSNNNNSNSNSSRQDEGLQRRRAEENAAFVRMLEEEASKLQASSVPRQQQQRIRELVGVSDYHNYHHPQDDPYRDPSRRNSPQPPPEVNQCLYPTDQGRHEYSHPAPREFSLLVREQLMPPTSPSSGHQEGNWQSHQSREPAFFPPHNPLLEKEPMEYPLDLNLEETRKETSTDEDDRRHPSQLQLFQRQQRHRSLSPSAPSHPNHAHIHDRPRHRESTPNRSCLIEENEDSERALAKQMEHMQIMAQQRRLPTNYDEVLNGNNADRDRPGTRQGGYDMGNSREIAVGSNNHHQDARLPSSSGNLVHHPKDYQYRPPPPLEDCSTTKLLPPVACIEFPTDWHGMEIEETDDDDLMDRDQDYFRRQERERAQRMKQQQQQQNRVPPRKSYSCISRESYADSLRPAGTKHMTIEVSPGVNMRFRGSEETWQAIANNRICQAECFGCCIPLYCLEDAELVVCPDCQTISPVGRNSEANKGGGLGLGFKEEQLMQWHSEM